MNKLAKDMYSKKLKLLRYQLDLSQGKMAQKLELCQQAYSKLENGKTNFTPQRISQICKAFNIQEEDFISLETHTIQKSIDNYHENNLDHRIAAINMHYELLLLESELRNVKLEQKIRNYKPFQDITGKDTPLNYVMI